MKQTHTFYRRCLLLTDFREAVEASFEEKASRDE